jgi:hypothetical protein
MSVSKPWIADYKLGKEISYALLQLNHFIDFSNDITVGKLSASY